jgi:hypothetical protein
MFSDERMLNGSFNGSQCVFEATPANVWLISVNVIIFCVSGVGNSVMMVILARQRGMRTVTNLVSIVCFTWIYAYV